MDLKHHTEESVAEALQRLIIITQQRYKEEN